MGSSESSSPVFDTSGQDQFKSLKSNNNQGKTGQIQNQKAKKLLSKISISIDKLVSPMPDLQQYDKMYNDSNGDISKFFDAIQERISQLYISLSKQTLQLMTEHKLSTMQGKLFIAQEVLYTSMNILKILGLKSNYVFQEQIVTTLNNLQLSMIGYMKAKYPRQSKNFVPGQLLQQFKNIDFVQKPQNDILRHLKIHFGDEQQNKIITKVKQFINAIMDQLDDKFTIFQQILTQKVFVITKQGKQYTVSNKIGRKIPESAEKFSLQDQSSIDLKSPEIFRVIVKWVNDMEDYILHSQDQLKQKDHFKTVNIQGSEIQFDYISVDELQQKMQQLQANLQKYQTQYSQEMKQLKRYIQVFNHNLIKILTKAERTQKYVPKKQAQIIKYSMFNKRLLSWMLIQKLKMILKKLIKTSKMLQQSTGINLDLVKFNVTDLMRAMMVGNKFQIMKVYQNLKVLQNSGVIKMIKIKNRLDTPLNDAMIIFKLQQSFLICELQLILSDTNQNVNEKLKNIEALNHFFYQLQRSPYGVMAELAALLSFKDNKTNFQQKITFQNIPDFSMQKCQTIHKQCVKQYNQQPKPIICSHCTQFYNAYANPYQYNYCQKCNNYFCFQCLKKQKNLNQSSFRQKQLRKQVDRVAQQLAQKQAQRIKVYFGNMSQQTKYANLHQFKQKILGYLNLSSAKPLRELTRKNYIGFKQIQKYLISTLKQADKKDPQYKRQFYFTVCIFRGGKINLIQMKYDKINKMHYCFNFKKKEEINKIQFKFYDFILINDHTDIKWKGYMNPQQTQYSTYKMFKNYLQPDANQFQKYYFKAIQINNKLAIQIPICLVDLIVDILNYNSDKQYANGNKKIFVSKSIQQLRQYLPNLLQTRQNVNLYNEGIESKHLTYFSQIQWKTALKYLNLGNNKLQQISVVLLQLPNLQKLQISQNMIRQINFTKKLNNFIKLVAYDNYISQFSGIQNIPNIQSLNLNRNYLSKFPFSCSLHKIRYLSLDDNQLETIANIDENIYPKLINMQLSGDYNRQVQIPLEYVIDLPSLVVCSIKNISGKSLKIVNVRSLQTLIMYYMGLDFFQIEQPTKLKKLQIKYCQSMQNQQNTIFIDKLLNLQYPSLIQLDITSIWGISKLQALLMPNLKRLSITECFIQDLSKFDSTKLISLQSLVLQGIQKINSLPVLNLLKVNQIKIKAIAIQDIKNISQWNVSNLQTLQLGDLISDIQIPILDHIITKAITIKGGKTTKQFAIHSSCQQIFFAYMDFQNFIPMNLNNLKHLHIQNCAKVDLTQILGSKLDNIQIIQLYNLALVPQKQYLPILNFPHLVELKIVGSRIQDASNISLSTLPCLKTLNLQNNSLTKLPSLNSSKLQVLRISINQIQSLKEFENSNLPCLKQLWCNQNKITEFPVLNLPRVVQISFENCEIKSILNLSLSKLPLLQIINLNGQKHQITVLPKLDLPSLVDINFNKQKVNNIQQFGLSKFEKLKILKLQHMNLSTKLPIFNLNSVTLMSFKFSLIEDFSNLTASKLPQLNQLDMSYTKIKVLPILRFQNLQKLVCNHDNQHLADQNKSVLQDISNFEFCVLPKLTTIQFECNKIKKLPKLSLPKLKSIYLSNNTINDTSQFKKSQLPVLQTINVYQNNIAQLPVGKNAKPTMLYMNKAEIQNFDQLKEYSPYFENFYYNQGRQITSWPVVNFKNVRIFQIMSCNLKSIDHIMNRSFINLRELAFSNNKIQKFPQLYCPKLLKLHANKNIIRDVSQFVKSDLNQSTMISFENNQIQHLPDFPFVNTTEIFMSHNFFTDISFMSKHIYEKVDMLVFYNCKIENLGKINGPNITRIYFNLNNIKSLEGLRGSNLPLLNLLQLSQNKISDVSPLNFMNLQNLSTLQLSKNNIQILKALKLKKLYNLNLTGNPIKNVDNFVQNSQLTQISNLDFSLTGSNQQIEINNQKVKKLRQYFQYTPY